MPNIYATCSPYTYFIKHIETGYFYYGVKYAKDANPETFWKTYFTSSKIVKKLIELYGKDSFDVKILKIYNYSEIYKALEDESNLIKEHWKNELCLNGNNGGRSLDTNKGRKIKNPYTGLSSYDIGTAKMLETRLNNGSYKTGSVKMVKTKYETKNKDGLNIFETSSLKRINTIKLNFENYKKSINKMVETRLNNGSYKTGTIKMVKTKLEHKNEDGLNIFEVSSKKAMNTMGKIGLSNKNLKTANTLRETNINGKTGLEHRARKALESRNATKYVFCDKTDKIIFSENFIGEIIKQINDKIKNKINIKVITNSSKNKPLFSSKYYNDKRKEHLKKKGFDILIGCYLKKFKSP